MSWVGREQETEQSISLRQSLTFGFETTWSIPDWWLDPGFCSAWESPRKLELMESVALILAQKLSVPAPTKKMDQYESTEWEIYNYNRELLFRVVSEPGTIEINTPPVLAGNIESSLTPLFDAAKEAGLVPYRSWWYGWKSGTMGGCHINMAGFRTETNPWIKDPILVLKYFAYFHNRPWLLYPFMGPDIGYGGNCMRMDEYRDSRSSMERFEDLRLKVNRGYKPSVDDIYRYFEGTSLREVKHSCPTLRKVKLPECLVEDRGVEMLREPKEFEALAELRIKILERLQNTAEIEPLKDFGSSLHEIGLSALYLSSKLEQELLSLGLPLKDYEVFLERQFPILTMGEDVPKKLVVREGRRERKVVGVQEAEGDMVLSKLIDSRYKRFEFHPQAGHKMKINGHLFEASSYGVLLDVFAPFANEVNGRVAFEIEVLDNSDQVVEKTAFDPNAMMFVTSQSKVSPVKTRNSNPQGYYNLESQQDFAIL